jgi:molybdopterin synthase sulfur carrier subunit
MRVSFFATIRKITGCTETEIPYQETAGALAHSLCDRYGSKLRQQIFLVENSDAEEKFSPAIIILVNGRNVCHLGGVAAPLKSDDRVDIFPMLAGG